MTIRVSNHALLRYIERVLGIDVEAIRAEIAELAAPDSPDLARLVVEDGIVVTVLGEGMYVNKSKRKMSDTKRRRISLLQGRSQGHMTV